MTCHCVLRSRGLAHDTQGSAENQPRVCTAAACYCWTGYLRRVALAHHLFQKMADTAYDTNKVNPNANPDPLSHGTLFSPLPSTIVSSDYQGMWQWGCGVFLLPYEVAHSSSPRVRKTLRGVRSTSVCANLCTILGKRRRNNTSIRLVSRLVPTFILVPLLVEFRGLFFFVYLSSFEGCSCSFLCRVWRFILAPFFVDTMFNMFDSSLPIGWPSPHPLLLELTW